MTTAYVRSPSVLWRETATAVMARHVDGRGTTLSGTGMALWAHLRDPRTLGELVTLMQASFSDPDGHLAQDLDAALRRLCQDGVVMMIERDER